MLGKITKWLAIVFLGLLALIAGLILLLPTQWGVKAGLSIASTMIDLEYQGIQGSLYSNLQFEELNIQTPTIDIRAKDVNLDLKLTCLFDLNLCVNDLHLGSLAVDQTGTQESSSEASENGYIELPLAVSLDKFSIDSFVFLNANQPMVSLDALAIKQASMQGPDVQVQRIQLQQLNVFSSPTTQASQQSSQSPQSFWLDTLVAQLEQAPQIQIPDVFIPVNAEISELSLSKFNQVANDNQSTMVISELNSQLRLQNQKLDSNGELQLHQGLADSQISYAVNLALDKAFSHELNLDVSKQNNRLTLTSEGDLKEVAVNISDKNAQILQTKVQTDFEKDNLPLDIQMNLSNTASLLEFLDIPLDANIRQGQIAIKGNWRDGYNNSIDIELEHPEIAQQQNSSNIQGEIGIYPQQVEVDANNLIITGALGELNLTGKTQYQQKQLTNKYNVDIDGLALNLLHQQLPANLNGNLEFATAINEQGMTLDLTCDDVNGIYLEKPLQANCELKLLQSGQVQIKGLQLSLGDNQLNLTGTTKLPSSKLWQATIEWAQAVESNLEIDLQAQQLAVLHQELAGSLRLEGVIEGNLYRPRFNIQTSGQKLSFAGDEVENIDITAAIDSGENWLSDIQIQVASAEIQGQTLENAEISFSGDLEQHNLSITAKHPQVETLQRLTGRIVSLDDLHWQGQLEESEFEHDAIRLTLKSAANIDANVKQNSYTVSSACWDGEDENTEFCIDQANYQNQKAKVSARFDYNLGKLMNYFLPELVMDTSDVLLSSKLEGTYDSQKGADFLVTNLLQGRLDTPEHRLELTAIVANMHLLKEELITNVFAGTTATGAVGLQSRLQLTPDARTHQGQLSIRGVDLSLLKRFIPVVNSLQGMVNGSVGFSGEIAKPELSGELIVEQGELILDAYTYPLTNFNQTIEFKGQSADVVGRFLLGKGEANYSVNVDFGEEFAARGEITGSKVQLAYKQHQADISPDIVFDVDTKKAMVKGEIVIEKTDIKIDQLPESARSPSSDVIVIGEVTPEPVIPFGLDIAMNIKVDPQEKGNVNIDALDLKASLSGDLELTVIQKQRENSEGYQPMKTYLNGYLNILDGSYDAWGQNLVIQEGSIHFNGEPSLPQFDVSAIRNPLNTTGDVVAGVRVTGNPIIPKVELFSDPPMSQARQISYLLQGQDLDGEAGDINTNLINVLVGFGVGRSENRISQFGRALGFDSLNIQTAGQGDGTQLQLTGRISEKLQITYGVGVFDAASVVILKYQLLPQLYVEATSGVNNALDIFYEISRGKMD
ncbi:translocation/assembly module TamB domain-containing protein [Glaciecola sp. 1036]|uniref:translocation/assembly module TamB domain-containing protein n=1 Tax=Alteromonadaceae TaxID=72275 RepID=UPI003CFC3907